MTCSACPRDRVVTLTDGEQCCSWCHAFRHECEARWMIALPNKSERRRYLDVGVPYSDGRLSGGVRKIRGDAAVMALEDMVRKLWEKR